MARGRKKAPTKSKADEGIMHLIPFDKTLIEDTSKKPNIMIDNFVGICIDELNYELVKIKEVLVTEENIKSTKNVYEDKYTIGDTYQEWVTMGSYLDDLVGAVKFYNFNIKFKNELSKLEYCTDMSVIVKILSDIKGEVNKFMTFTSIPQVVTELDKAMKAVKDVKQKVSEVEKVVDDTVKVSNELISIVAEKRIKMVSSGIIDNKKTKHPHKEEK